MEYIKATEKDLEQISMLVKNTIQETYPARITGVVSIERQEK